MSLHRHNHIILAPFAFLLFFTNIFSAFLYTICKHVFQIEKSYISFLLFIHQGSIFGYYGRILYCVLLAALSLYVVVSGYMMLNRPIWKRHWPNSVYGWHQWATSVLFVGLAVTSLSGALYRVLRMFLEKEYTQWLMYLHAHTYAPSIQVAYVSAFAICGTVMLYTGAVMYVRTFSHSNKKLIIAPNI